MKKYKIESTLKILLDLWEKSNDTSKYEVLELINEALEQVKEKEDYAAK